MRSDRWRQCPSIDHTLQCLGRRSRPHVADSPLVVRADQAGPVDGQDAVPDPQPAVGGGGPVGDQGADVDPRSVQRGVLQGVDVARCEPSTPLVTLTGARALIDKRAMPLPLTAL